MTRTLWVLLLVSCSQPKPLPRSLAPYETNGTLAVEWAGQRAARGLVDFQIVNSTPFDLPVTGYAADSYDPPLEPSRLGGIYQVRVLRGGAWEPVEIGWCGTGVTRVMVDAGSTRRFSVTPPEPRDWDQLRVGITVSDAQGPHVVWSAAVSRSEL